MPQKSLLAALCAAIALVCAPSASAATTDIGGAAAREVCGAAGYSWAFVDPGSVVPAGGTKITEFRTYSANADAGKAVSFVVLTPWAQKPQGVTGKVYLVKSQTAYTHEGGDVVRKISASVPVAPGDLLGLAFTGTQACAWGGGSTDALEANWFRQPIQTGSLIWNLQNIAGYRLNIAASVETPDTALTLDSYRSNNPQSKNAVETARPLEAGRDYNVTVQGTFSYYAHALTGSERVAANRGWRVCHQPENAPLFPSAGITNGRAGADAVFVFSRPVRLNKPCPPVSRGGTVRFSTDGGEHYTVPTPVGGLPSAPAADHRYTYRVTGQGKPLSVTLRDRAYLDNFGALKITVAPVG